jgi:hypothetical protein
MNGRDQHWNLIGRDLVAPNICGDDFCGEFSMGVLGRSFVGHF